MAAFFTGGDAGTDVQAGTDGLQTGAGLQTLYLMNPNYVGYTDAAAPAAPNMMLLNSVVSSLPPASFGHQPTPAAQHFFGIPVQPQPSGYKLWPPATTGGASDMSPRQQAPGTSAVSAVLSMSSRVAPTVTVAAVPSTEGKYKGASPTPSQEHAVMSSKYLKGAQELLDEAVSVSKGVEEANADAAVAVAKSATVVKKEDSECGSGGGAEDGGCSKSGGAAEMSTAEQQELHMKKSKLVNMLDEVEQRYRQYHHQMQAVGSSFEAVAGAGSARTYTALALRTISQQFRCLRDAIMAQVRSASRALGEDAEAAAGGRTVGLRLRFIDHQLRQLGMTQVGPWRPQRGLPKRSVSFLRAWLLDHFLHPYPKDSDKIMLAKQTGLTRSQVSNWFVNARVRLWKPMVDEMYLEETKDKDANAAAGKMSNDTDSAEPPKHVDNGTSSSAGATSKAARIGIGSSKVDVHASLLELAGDQQAHAGFYGDDSGASFQRKLKKARTESIRVRHTNMHTNMHT